MVTINNEDDFGQLILSTISILQSMVGEEHLESIHQWPIVQTSYTLWWNFNTDKPLTDFPFTYNSTDYVKLYGNLGIYLYGLYVILIALTLITTYASWGLIDKYLVQIALVDPLKWLRRYNWF